MTDKRAPAPGTSRDELTGRGIADSIQGKVTKAKGKIEDAVGELTGDLKAKAKGKMDQVKGSAQDFIGKTEREAGKNKPGVDADDEDTL
jgi:uncharacterized protein YjbJ (UPF0337 family)